MNAVIVTADIITAYGQGLACLWDGVCAGQCAVRPVVRFPVDAFACKNAALIDSLDGQAHDSLVMQMLRPMLEQLEGEWSPAIKLLLATTTGEIDWLQRGVVEASRDVADSLLSRLLKQISRICGGLNNAMVISSACASSTVAIAQAASLIRSGIEEAVLVVACDCITEFVFSGFSALQALDPDVARPFDQHRAGLSLGEGAGCVLMMSEERARRLNRPILGEVAGWGMSNDANHMTGPSRDGAGLKHAIELALKTAGVAADRVGAICAHGTGTAYNDSMEMKAFKAVFGQPLSTFSIKGGSGHTMGSAGLIEAVLSLHAVTAGMLPGTVGLSCVDDEAEGWVSNENRTCDAEWILSTNSGFGGTNAALLLKKQNVKGNTNHDYLRSRLD
ncbi:MAG: beta-ketoacyl-[acyl-carrier-protein] synthase family protein [Spartobacteria bacterium]|nr:beta-ketoacyl-[acyl-carrier-protein] synthase family protein [Spartobacteria bacterium]